MYQNEVKKVTKITEEIYGDKIEPRQISQEQLQREVAYIRAEQILKELIKKKLITEAEFNKITALNRETFSPVLARIMP